LLWVLVVRRTCPPPRCWSRASGRSRKNKSRPGSGGESLVGDSRCGSWLPPHPSRLGLKAPCPLLQVAGSVEPTTPDATYIVFLERFVIGPYGHSAIAFGHSSSEITREILLAFDPVRRPRCSAESRRFADWTQMDPSSPLNPLVFPVVQRSMTTNNSCPRDVPVV
jgi:hypothetical protein